MIKKTPKGYMVVSKTTGRNLGVSPTKAGAIKREKQVEMFKHMKVNKKK
jgi:hypothetical protein